eukprot:Blabericola_migrator_1__5426@NODE_2776_length_2370_cov_6_513244_g1738_i0_p2_GENE_NODE_2776_length_2370_cov_6_513244_g1738_i0NODE_2776_length_2370_cov_6_513244_g1738_i0_p2_ORF_typecomplete_len168_score22_89_NODE_2776_length_2370_cov_6_513244_g1738_i012631766
MKFLFSVVLTVTALAQQEGPEPEYKSATVINPLSPTSWLNLLSRVEFRIPEALQQFADNPRVIDILPRLIMSADEDSSGEGRFLRPALEIPGVGVVEALPKMMEVNLVPPEPIETALENVGLDRFVPPGMTIYIPEMIHPIPRNPPSWMVHPWLGPLNPANNYAGNH